MKDLSQTRIFDHALLRTRRDRASILASTEPFLWQILAERLCERLQDVARNFSSALVVGAGSLVLAEGLKGIPNVTWFDPSEGLLQKHEGQCVLAEGGALPFADHSFDLVISFLELHHVDHPVHRLEDYHRVLVPDGLFLGVLGGAGSLVELRDCLMKAELDLLKGGSPHFSPLPEVGEMGAALTKAGFKLPVVDHDLMTLLYNHPQQLVDDLRLMAEGNILCQGSKRGMQRKVRDEAFRLYKDHYTTPEGKITATADMLFVHGWR